MNTSMNKQTINDADDEIIDSSDSTVAPSANDISTPSMTDSTKRKSSPDRKSKSAGAAVQTKPEKEESRGRWFVFQVVASCILFFSTIAVVIILVRQKTSPKEITDVRQAPLVKCVTVAPYSEEVNISISGIATPFREINIAAEVTGAITFKSDFCQSGRYVTAGTELLKIDSRKYQLAKDRLISELAEADAQEKRAEVELEGARGILKLLVDDLQFQSTENQTREKLFKNNAISETELTNSRRSLITAMNAEKTQRNRVATLEADLTAQKSRVALKKVQQEEAQIDFEKATITAPSDGVIITENVQLGDFVQASAPLLIFEDTSAIQVKCDLRADQLQTVLDAKQTAPDAQTDQTNLRNRFKLPPLNAKIIYASNNEEFEWTGVLDRYDGLGLDERTRTAPCLIKVTETKSKSNPKSKTGTRILVRGMFVSVELGIGEQNGLLAIPAETVRAGNVVWVNQNKKLKKQKIKVLNRVTAKDGSEIVIVKSDENGLQVGQSIVLSPIPQPTDQMTLRVMNEDGEQADTDAANENNTTDDKPVTDSEQDSKKGELSK